MKALVGAFSVIVKTGCKTDGSSAALFVVVVHRKHMKQLQSYKVDD